MGPNVTRCTLPEADHTFSQQAWKQWAERMTLDWVSISRQSRGP